MHVTQRRVRRPSSLVWGVKLAPLIGATAWLAYSAFGIDHNRPLPAALPGDWCELDTAEGSISVYSGGPQTGTPLLLVHSINAAASAYEVRPLFMHYRNHRPVYAIDLPGFGLSERPKRVYTPRLMVDAIHAVAAFIASRHDGQEIDVIALSLSCEYAARAALEQPERYRSLGLISPTGFDLVLSGEGAAQSTRGSPLTLATVSVPIWSRALFDALVSRPSMRLFLERTWGSKRIDEGLLDYGQLSAHQPGAPHAVWSFLAGYLFAADISRIYALLKLPVWAVHGVRGDFVDYRYERDVQGKPNWSLDQFATGAFPHFEQIDAVTSSYDRFLNGIM